MKQTESSLRVLYASILILLLIGVAGLAHDEARAQSAASNPASNPWTPAEVIQPGQLAAMLSHDKGAKLVLIHVGFAVLYRSKHIPGSIYAGPASKPEGLQALKDAVGKLPKDTDIYIYCGCCPIYRCPNIRPAFRTLKALGFTHLHVLMLETNFGKDWVAHGYPIAGESVSGR